MWLFWCFVLLCCVVTRISAGIAASTAPGADDVDMVKHLVAKGCAQKYTWTCLKLDVAALVDQLAHDKEYRLLPGIALVRDNDTNNGGRFPVADVAASIAREHPNDVDARLDAYLVKRVAHYLDTHAVSFRLYNPEAIASAKKMGEDTARLFVGTGRGHAGGGGGFGGGKGGGGGMAAAGAMMGGTLLSLGFGAVAMLAGKALMTGLMSLMLSAIVGLKGGDSGGGKTTYEIVSKPVYSHSHSHSSEVQHAEHGHGGYGHSGYGRSFESNYPYLPPEQYTPVSESVPTTSKTD